MKSKISTVLARPSTQAAPYNTAYATSYQATDLTILSEVPSSLLTHQTADVFFLDLPCMSIVDAKGIYRENRLQTNWT